MSEGAEKSVDELLAEAAAATEAHNPPKAKKTRTPKATETDAEGNVVAKPERKPREPKVGKTYPQADGEGNELKDEEGNAVMGPYATRYKAPKAAKEPKARVPKMGAITLHINDEPVQLSSIQNEAHLQVVGNIGSKEGSKRSARAAAFSGAGTVAEFYTNGGMTKDLLRHLKTGAVKLEVPGRGTVVVKEKGEAVIGDPAAQTPDTDGVLSPDVPANALDGGASDANNSTH